MKLLLIPNFTKEQTLTAVERILCWSESAGVSILMEECFRSCLDGTSCRKITFLPQITKDLLTDCTCILTVGGDGTVVRAAQYSAYYNIPLVGVNTGTLGFLANIELSELEEKLERIRCQQYGLERRFAISARWDDKKLSFAVNDIVLQKIMHDGLACAELYCSDEMVGRYRADGVIVATPTGSTAYSYAAGGSVIDPAMEAIEVIPICPQTRSNYAMVCAPSKTIQITVISGKMRVFADGAAVGVLDPGGNITVSRSELSPQMIQFDNQWGLLSWQKKLNMI